MASPPVDPDRFDEAVEHFRSRVPVSPERFRVMDARAKRKAFTVGDVAQLDLINDVWVAIDKAIANGTTLEDFKAEIGDKLASEWGGENPSRLDTIFRTNVQISYSAGRWKQLKDPAITDFRPYWRYSVILDSRTSEICRPLAGTVLPADDPWWESHNPPCHFNCRSGIIALTQEQAEGLGLTEKAPEAEAADGFGLAPGAEEWHPDLSQYPAALRKIYEEG